MYINIFSLVTEEMQVKAQSTFIITYYYYYYFGYQIINVFLMAISSIGVLKRDEHENFYVTQEEVQVGNTPWRTFW